MPNAALSVHHGSQTFDGVQARWRGLHLGLVRAADRNTDVEEVLRNGRASCRASTHGAFVLVGRVEKVMWLDVTARCQVVVVVVFDRGREGPRWAHVGCGWAHAGSGRAHGGPGWAHVGSGGVQDRSSPLLKKRNKPVRLRVARDAEGHVAYTQKACSFIVPWGLGLEAFSVQLLFS